MMSVIYKKKILPCAFHDIYVKYHKQPIYEDIYASIILLGNRGN